MAETVGSIIDKISIIELKIFHMSEQTQRQDASSAHIKESLGKIKIMEIQKKDLACEISLLIKNLVAGKAELKLYRQFKMYNDPKYRCRAGEKR